jgi:predicted PurR-regulated permease PerM
VLLGAGLFLALPFVLSIGSVVFLPVVAAIILSIVLSPLADRLAAAGLPNVLASLVAVSAFIAIVILAFALILQPAVEMFDNVQAMMDQLGQRFTELRGDLDWLNDLSRQFSGLIGQGGRREVVLARPVLCWSCC